VIFFKFWVGRIVYLNLDYLIDDIFVKMRLVYFIHILSWISLLYCYK
jgi:hypothetical protein